MSVKIMSEVWEHSSHKSTELLTLIALADWANDDGFCWYGMSRIAKRVRIERRGLARVMSALVTSGELERLRRYQDEKKVNETTVSIVMTGCSDSEKARRRAAAFDHLKGIVKAEMPPSVLDALEVVAHKPLPNVPQAITPNGPRATRSVIDPSKEPSESLKPNGETTLVKFWETEIKTPVPGGIFLEKLAYRIEVHGMEKVRRCLLKANEYGKAHNLPYLDKIIAEDKPENGNGHKPAPAPDRKPARIYK